MFQETVSLVLKHADINTDSTLVSASSEAGMWENGKQTTSFHINLRKLMGNEMYDNNEMFVLRLNQLTYGSANFPLVDNNDNLLEVNLSGLNFINSTYDVRTGNNSNIYRMLLLNMAKNTGTTMSYSPNTSLCNFKKSSDNVHLKIELIRISDGLPAQQYGTNKFPHCAYSFDIYPVKNGK